MYNDDGTQSAAIRIKKSMDGGEERSPAEVCCTVEIRRLRVYCNVPQHMKMTWKQNEKKWHYFLGCQPSAKKNHVEYVCVLCAVRSVVFALLLSIHFICCFCHACISLFSRHALFGCCIFFIVAFTICFPYLVKRNYLVCICDGVMLFTLAYRFLHVPLFVCLVILGSVQHDEFWFFFTSLEFALSHIWYLHSRWECEQNRRRHNGKKN